MKIKIILVFLFVNSLYYSNDNELIWEKTGHRIVGEIAHKHLTEKAKKNIKNLLNDENLAVISTFADEIKSDKKYDKFKPWHYINFKDGETYETSKKNPKGDLIVGIKKCQEVISNPDSSKEDKVFYLKLLVHLVGDLHQPLHVGKPKDRGGNAIKVKWFGKNTNLHYVWDSKMLDQYGMSYTELSQNLNTISKKQAKSIQKGSLIDWVNEGRILAIKAYDSAKTNDNLSFRYMYDYFETVKTQLTKGGVRLAKILNELFG